MMFYFFLFFSLYYLIGYDRLNKKITERVYKNSYQVIFDWGYYVFQIVSTIWWVYLLFSDVNMILTLSLLLITALGFLYKWVGNNLKTEATLFILKGMIIFLICF